ncbi:methyltransferase domain-containing protein [Microbacterium sp. W1N]|uniref:methyltransferase domain-containing protein n=1 Tax=Microbacterium festucae TaxID=2977531 RepID=UPI0021BDF0CD|nr:methyltransferase domain-containing protein [Microbacterium festucae]MCT9819636.1 methyltransferase domain-containing protein [Microbacterium festucae]
MTGLAARDERLRELMDDPDCDPVRLRRTLERFAVVNRLVSGWGTVYRTRVRPALRAVAGPARIVDIGCGGGDVLRGLVARARRDGFEVTGLGIDPDERGLAVSRATALPGVDYRAAHSSDLVAAGERFDIAVSNHVLHHLDARELATVLDDSAALAPSLALHSDIARSRLAYAAYAVGITPLAPGSFLRTDGLRSIRRSRTVAELATLPGWDASAPVPFRVLLTRSASAPTGPASTAPATATPRR